MAYLVRDPHDTFATMTDSRAILCPYCGDRQVPSGQCRSCGGLFDRWSLHATQNDMGAWYIRDVKRPHFVGFSYEALVAAIRAGDVGREAIVRGPSTRQFWTIARRAPGLAHLFGRCHACQSPVLSGSQDASADDDVALDLPINAQTHCGTCGATTQVGADRNFFGLTPIEPLDAPKDAKADLSAFVLDSGLLILAALPPQAPPQTSPQTPPQAIVAVTRAVTVVVPIARPLADFDHAAPPHARSALSAFDRSLAERVRHLERVNRVLILSSAFAVAFMLLFGFAYFLLRDQHEVELAKSRALGADDVRAEFSRSAPVVTEPTAPLPALAPTTPEVAGPKVPK